MQSALFVGRFQPFHRGHLEVVKNILKENERVIIVIGSAEKNFIKDNPLTAGERYQMIEESLKEAGVLSGRYCIIPVCNINNYALWVNHVNSFVPEYTRLYTGSDIVKACYEWKYSRDFRTTKAGPEIRDLKREFKISATAVREAWIKGKDTWEKMVSEAVAKRVKEWKIIERMSRIKEVADLTQYNNSY